MLGDDVLGRSAVGIERICFPAEVVVVVGKKVCWSERRNAHSPTRMAIVWPGQASCHDVQTFMMTSLEYCIGRAEPQTT